MRLVFASNNAHKLQEVREILPAACEVLSLSDIGFADDIDETGETLEANSLLKAQAVWDYLVGRQMQDKIDGVFSDDTGLEIRALGGQPGVRTARWSGEPVDHARNRQKALAELRGKEDRKARFRTVVTLIRDGKAEQVEGIVEGEIATEEWGGNGFGYDPLFIPKGYTKTFAQLSADIKNSISHRARAIQALCKIL
ncbi:MAG: RdgB/HAM1 family non-canonical purine NTP pyrophosphatase [Paludibacteraceae bacterium]|nr:RdgB/HAM1 family non-canonical purine NTP pyrophosphatase [Paludibacteraceae bacterium]